MEPKATPTPKRWRPLGTGTATAVGPRGVTVGGDPGVVGSGGAVGGSWGSCAAVGCAVGDGEPSAWAGGKVRVGTRGSGVELLITATRLGAALAVGRMDVGEGEGEGPTRVGVSVRVRVGRARVEVSRSDGVGETVHAAGIRSSRRTVSADGAARD